MLTITLSQERAVPANLKLKLMNRRLLWIDVLRGSCILLVILHHWLLHYVDDSKLLASAFFHLDHALAPIRMELLVFLSGMLVARSAAKGAFQYFDGKVKKILYPYAIWTAFMFLVLMPIQSPVELPAYTYFYSLKFFIGFTDLTWFLYWIFTFYIIQYFARQLKTSTVLLLTVSLYLLVSKLEPRLITTIGEQLYAHHVSLTAAIYLFFYFYLGDKFSAYIMQKEGDVSFKPGWVALSAVSFAAVVFIATRYQWDKFSLFYLPFVAGSLLALFALARWASNTRPAQALGFIGRHSLIYYLGHYPIMVLLARLTEQLPTDAILFPTAVLFISLLLPWLFIKHYEKKSVTLLFEWPSAVPARKAAKNSNL